MKKSATPLLLCLLTSPLANAEGAIHYGDYRAANTPVNYSYIYAGAGIKSYDALDENINVLQLSGQTLLNEFTIFKLGYQLEKLDQTINSTEDAYQNNLANMGIGWRIPVLTSTDIELDGQLLYHWNDDTDAKNIGLGAGVALHQGLGETLDAKLAFNYSTMDDVSTGTAELTLTQYITRYIGVGINAQVANQDDDLGNSHYIGLHVKLAFY